MSRRTKYALGVLGALALAGTGSGLALAGGGAENDAGEHATGTGADRATAAALKLTGGGHANAVERDGENGATWEVEITKPNGDTVDVRLDQDYGKVVIEGDSEDDAAG